MYQRNSPIRVKIGLLLLTTILAFPLGLNETLADTKDSHQRHDAIFTEAMREVYQRYSDDPDGHVIYAESLMDLHPWDYWTGDNKPRPWTPEIRKVL